LVGRAALYQAINIAVVILDHLILCLENAQCPQPAQEDRVRTGHQGAPLNHTKK
jgi:hypothetical protein